MGVSRIERRFIGLTVPEPAYQQIAMLAKQEKRSIASYVRQMLFQHLEEQNLPIFYSDSVHDQRD